MARKWYSVWNSGIPQSFEPDKFLLDYFKDRVEAAPDRVALSYYGYDINYRELDEAIDRFAWGLAGLGVGRGDRVALFMQNCPQFVIGYFGTLRAGGVVVSLNSMFKHAELEYEINDSGAETLVAIDALYPEVVKIKDRVKLRNVIVTSYRDYLPQDPTLPLPPEMKPPKAAFPGTLDFLELLAGAEERKLPKIGNMKEEIALLQYTGGTTGLPKGAVITHYNLAQGAMVAALVHSYTPSDVHLGVAPFFHIMGMIQCMCSSLATGGRLVILTRFATETLAQAVEQYGCTVWITNTTMVIAVLEWPGLAKYDLSNLRVVSYGGSAMPEVIWTKLKKLVPRAMVAEGYGLSETTCLGLEVVSIAPFKPGFIGIPTISTDMRIVDLETGTEEVEPGQEGEITIKGPSVMSGYWNKPEATQETLKDGWLYTGDIGIMDEEGYVAISGRKKELIKCSGYSVFPSEVEELLYRHPAIAEVAVIGVPDSYRGETPKAFVVLKPDYKGKIGEQDIVEWAKENMATYKRPRLVELRAQLPKSGAGKILRRVLAEEQKKGGKG